jgi:hypothetical protein
VAERSNSWLNADTRRRRVAAISKAMRLSAERRKCKACGRRAATSRHDVELVDGIVLRVRKCRFCGHEEET